MFISNNQGQAYTIMQVYSQEEVADIGGTATAPSPPLGLLKQLLSAFPHKLVDHPPGGNAHVLHPLLVELGPAVASHHNNE